MSQVIIRVRSEVAMILRSALKPSYKYIPSIGNAKAKQAKFEGSLKLEAGEFVAFYVGNGGDGHARDAVGLDAVITAEK